MVVFILDMDVWMLECWVDERVIMVLVMMVLVVSDNGVDTSPFLHISHHNSHRLVMSYTLFEGWQPPFAFYMGSAQGSFYTGSDLTYIITYTYIIPLIRILPSNSNGIHRRHTTLHMALQNSNSSPFSHHNRLTPYIE